MIVLFIENDMIENLDSYLKWVLLSHAMLNCMTFFLKKALAISNNSFLKVLQSSVFNSHDITL